MKNTIKVSKIILLITTLAFVAPIAAKPNPVCVEHWGKLRAKRALGHARTLIKNKCAVIYRKGWLKGKGVKNVKLCRPAWIKLSRKRGIVHARTLVKKKCAVLKRKGWL